MSQSDPPPAGRVFPLATVALGLWAVGVASFVILGSDLMWVVALGDQVRADHAVPVGIPFATAPQDPWHNPIVVAQLLLSAVHAAGGPALAALQVAIVVGALAVLVAEGRRMGAGEPYIALVVSVVVVGGSSSAVVTRLPSLSLLPIVVACAVMRRQHEHASRGIWWLVPLFVIWGNLHGAVLVGLAVLGVFLIFSPGGGPWGRRAGVGFGCLLSLVATSAGLSTPAYYVTALGNEAAARGSDLWARPDLRHPLDLALVVATVILLALATRRSMPLWEWLVVVGLVMATVSAARNGIWLLLFLAPAAMRPRCGGNVVTRGLWRPALVTVVTVIGALAGVSYQLSSRGAAAQAPGRDAVEAIRASTGGGPVLADEPLAETLAQSGLTVWMANPIDAFPRHIQAEFLDFLHDGVVPPSAASVDVAAVAEELAPAVLEDGRWAEVSRGYGYVILRRLP
jgi:hypothetical protein